MPAHSAAAECHLPDLRASGMASGAPSRAAGLAGLPVKAISAAGRKPQTFARLACSTTAPGCASRRTGNDEATAWRESVAPGFAALVAALCDASRAAARGGAAASPAHHCSKAATASGPDASFMLTERFWLAAASGDIRFGRWVSAARATALAVGRQAAAGSRVGEPYGLVGGTETAASVLTTLAAHVCAIADSVPPTSGDERAAALHLRALCSAAASPASPLAIAALARARGTAHDPSTGKALKLEADALAAALRAELADRAAQLLVAPGPTFLRMLADTLVLEAATAGFAGPAARCARPELLGRGECGATWRDASLSPQQSAALLVQAGYVSPEAMKVCLSLGMMAHAAAPAEPEGLQAVALRTAVRLADEALQAVGGAGAVARALVGPTDQEMTAAAKATAVAEAKAAAEAQAAAEAKAAAEAQAAAEAKAAAEAQAAARAECASAETSDPAEPAGPPSRARRSMEASNATADPSDFVESPRAPPADPCADVDEVDPEHTPSKETQSASAVATAREADEVTALVAKVEPPQQQGLGLSSTFAVGVTLGVSALVVGGWLLWTGTTPADVKKAFEASWGSSDHGAASSGAGAGAGRSR